MIGQSAFSQNILFNDTLFKHRLIDNGIDINFDGEISYTEAAAVTNLDVSHGWNFYPIADMSGIEYFINLDTLNFSGNNLSSVNLSNNIQLQYLDASQNYNLDTLILGSNSFLEQINLNGVNTNSIFDFSGLPNLIKLEFDNATDLDMTSNANLRTLLCRFSKGQINVSNNPSLETLVCQGQSHLDLSSCSQLEYLQCYGDSIKLDSIDLSNNPLLSELTLWQNNLSHIDLSQNTALQQVELGYNHIPHIDFSNNVNITYLSCGGDSLRSVDITGLLNLQTLGTGNFLDSLSSNLDSIDLTTNVNLKHLYCPAGNLTHLDLSHNTLLQDLHCGYNNLDTIIICSIPNFTYLHCDGMPQLTHVFIVNTSSPPGYYSFGSSNWQFYSCTLLSVEENSKDANIDIFPNPVSQSLNIRNLTGIENISFEIIDINSKVVLQNHLSSNLIDVNKIKSGIYVLRLLKSNSIIIRKCFVKE